MDSAAPSPLRIRHVLLPLDGSARAAAALPTARAIAARFGADIVSVGVAADEREAEQLRREIGAAVAEVPGASVVVVTGADPATVITERAAALDASVVCMSTRGHGRVAGAVLGSVARAVLQRCSRPMITVGPQADRPPALVGKDRRRPAGWPEPLSVGGIIACVDGSSASEAVLPEAVRWAAALEVHLTILTVAEAAPVGTDGKRPNRFGPVDPEAYVERLAAAIARDLPNTSSEVVSDPISVAAGLRAHLAAHPAALVAVTTHARTGLDRLRLGAAAADIVRSSTVPSLVVPVARG